MALQAQPQREPSGAPKGPRGSQQTYPNPSPRETTINRIILKISHAQYTLKREQTSRNDIEEILGEVKFMVEELRHTVHEEDASNPREPKWATTFLTRVENRLQQIETNLKPDRTREDDSWAARAGRAPTGPIREESTRIQRMRPSADGLIYKQIGKQMREIIVRVEDTDRAGLKEMAEGEMVKKINEEISGAEAVGITKHKEGGGFTIHTSTEAGCKKLGLDKRWARKIFNTAFSKRHTFPIIAHNILVAEAGQTPGTRREEFIKEIIESNKELDLQIDNSFWMIRKNAETKPTTSLVLAVSLPETANKLCEWGIRIGHTVKDVTLFQQDSCTTQCFNCQEIGTHIANKCTKSTVCGHCAGAHKSLECEDKTHSEKWKCVNCKGPHRAWDKQGCRILNKRYAEARTRAQFRPNRYANGSARSGNTSPSSQGGGVSLMEFTGIRRGRPIGSTSRSGSRDVTPVGQSRLPYERKEIEEPNGSPKKRPRMNPNHEVQVSATPVRTVRSVGQASHEAFAQQANNRFSVLSNTSEEIQGEGETDIDMGNARVEEQIIRETQANPTNSQC
jgi:hypothetical protein